MTWFVQNSKTGSNNLTLFDSHFHKNLIFSHLMLSSLLFRNFTNANKFSDFINISIYWPPNSLKSQKVHPWLYNIPRNWFWAICDCLITSTYMATCTLHGFTAAIVSIKECQEVCHETEAIKLHLITHFSFAKSLVGIPFWPEVTTEKTQKVMSLWTLVNLFKPIVVNCNSL